MKKDMFIYIEDIIESMEAIEEYIKGLDYNKFEEDLGNCFKRLTKNKKTNSSDYSLSLIIFKNAVASKANPCGHQLLTS